MGKAGRAACIFTPMILTIASFVCLLLIEISGWNTLHNYYFFNANLTEFSPTGARGGGNAALTNALGNINTGEVAEIYNVYLWNYCSSNETDGSDLKCTSRKAKFVFDPVEIWGLKTSDQATSTSSADNAIESAIDKVKNKLDKAEDDVLGSTGKKAMNAYKQVAKWMFIGYQVSFWTSLATILVGILALFSRWGSLVTWILSTVNTIFTVASVIASTVLFGAVVKGLGEVLEPYGITLKLGRHALLASWLGAAFSFAATLFWVFSVCCCSGRSNPHHKDNKGGLWEAEPKGQGYSGSTSERGGVGREGKTEKVSSDYLRVESPYATSSPYVGEHSDTMPLNEWSQKPNNNNDGKFVAQPAAPGYEPYRHH